MAIQFKQAELEAALGENWSAQLKHGVEFTFISLVEHELEAPAQLRHLDEAMVAVYGDEPFGLRLTQLVLVHTGLTDDSPLLMTIVGIPEARDS